MHHANEFARKLVVNYADGSDSKAYRLSQELDLHTVNDLCFRQEGRHPAMLTIVGGVATASYESPVGLAFTCEV
jgi:hypothetical protein